MNKYLKFLRRQTNIEFAILVEVFESVKETEWFLEMERKNEFFKGVVGYADFTSTKFKDDLIYLKSLGRLVGVRKILDFCERDWLIRDDVIKSMSVLVDENLTFDLLIKSEAQYDSAKQFLKLIPTSLKVVVDHLGKPDAKNGASQKWFSDIEEFASYENVYCKLSGMVTEADWLSWKPKDFKQHIDHVIRCFGIDRVMFGSDWPVCKLANANLTQVYNLLDDLLKDLNENDRKKIFFTNAVKFYNLDI